MINILPKSRCRYHRCEAKVEENGSHIVCVCLSVCVCLFAKFVEIYWLKQAAGRLHFFICTDCNHYFS